MGKTPVQEVPPHGLSEAELYAPDLDEGVLDVEQYALPDESALTDPYLKKVWALARRQLQEGARGAT